MALVFMKKNREKLSAHCLVWLKQEAGPILFFCWVAYGQVLGYGIEKGFLINFSSYLFEHAGRLFPSINRLGGEGLFSNLYAQLHASTMLVSIPVLFLFLLASDVEESVSGVRIKNKEKEVALIFFCVATLVFFGGFGFSGPSKIFSSSFAGFSLLSSVLTFLSAYCFRMCFCIVFHK